MADVTLVDSGTGNLFSLREAFRRAGASVRITRSPEVVRGARCLVVPGVASFPAVVRGIATVRRPLLDSVRRGVPLLGVCAGMQLLFESSDEGPGRGLGVLPGRVARLEADIVPHMGWSRLRTRPDAWFDGVPPDPMVYFAHSYAAPADAHGTVATSDHGGPFAAAVRTGRVFGVQFHPEKSGRVGAAILGNFLREAGVVRSA
ncbi:MAG: imidazole glycerol phosphate synthase subunit HisH [Methanobacteriota archaeon]